MRFLRKEEWEPYIGPQGGEGWRNTETDEIVYQAQPPGGVQMPDEFPGEFLGMGEGDMPDSVVEMDGDEIVIASDGEGNITIDELDNISTEGFIFGGVDLDQEALEELGLDIGSGQEEPSTGTWNEIDSNNLDDVPEGTEVSFEYQGDVITGNLQVHDGGNVTEYLIGDILLTYADLAPADAEVYVNEETLPDENIDVYDNIEDVEPGTEVSIVYDDGEVQEGEFLGDTGGFVPKYTLDMDGTEVTIDEDDIDFIEVENEEDGVEEGELEDFEDFESDGVQEDEDGSGIEQKPLDAIDSKYTHISTEEYTFDPEEIKDYEISHDLIDIFNSVNGVVDVVDYNNAAEFLENPPEGVVPGELEKFLDYLQNEYGEDVEDGGDSETNDELGYEEFEGYDILAVPEDTYVEVETVFGQDISGEIIESKEEGVRIKKPNGDTTYLNGSDVTEGNAFEEKPEYAQDDKLTEVPENADADEIFEVMESRISLRDGDLGFGWKEDTADVLVEGYKNGASATELRWSIEKLSQEYSFRKSKIEDISEKVMQNFTTESEYVGDDVSFHRDSLGTINKMLLKSFTDKYPEYEDQMSQIKDSISAWTGGSRSPDSAPIWAVAVEEGKSNLPENIADEVDDVDPEKVDAMRDYVEHSREVLRDMYGDSIKAFRGISGSYGSDRSRDARRSKETTIDHRAVGSWSINPALAQDFARSNGAVACQEIDVDDIYVATFNRAGFQSELELVASGGVEDYEYERTGEKLDSGKVTGGGRINHFSGFEVFMENLDEYAL